MCSDGSAGPESLDGAGARSTEKLDISSWHYATGWSREKLSGRDIRSQGTLEHGGVSSRVVKDSYPWLSLGLGPLGRGIEDCVATHVTRRSPRSYDGRVRYTCPPPHLANDV